MTNEIKLRDFTIGNDENLSLMGGMNVLESRDLAMNVAEEFVKASEALNINYIFKGSYDKANRSSINSFSIKFLDLIIFSAFDAILYKDLCNFLFFEIEKSSSFLFILFASTASIISKLFIFCLFNS